MRQEPPPARLIDHESMITPAPTSTVARVAPVDGDDPVSSNGDDALWGAPGADRLIGGANSDTLHGGDDDDTCSRGPLVARCET